MSPVDPLPIEMSGPVDATVVLPGSKSITNRALVCAALATGPSTLTDWLDADDTQAMVGALRVMGAVISVAADGALQVGSDGPRPDVVSVDARQSGTTSRFLLPLLAIDGAARRIDGDQQLRVRPMGEAFSALRALGARVDEAGVPGFLPAVIEGPLDGGEVELGGDVSSQFLSGLLLTAPYMAAGLRAWISTPLISRPYVDMTVAVMEAFGVDVSTEGSDTWVVASSRYSGTEFTVEPDASAASYAWAAAVITGGAVTVDGLGAGSIQGDVAFVDVLEQMGASVHRDERGTTVSAGSALHGVDVDMSAISDTVPTLAVVAAFADSPTTVRNVGFIRHKETDRIAAPVAELRRCGIDARETDDGLVVVPGPIAPAVIETYDDHRMAMAFALLGLRAEGISIAGPGCVAKTFPGYWDLLGHLRSGAGPRSRTV